MPPWPRRGAGEGPGPARRGARRGAGEGPGTSPTGCALVTPSSTSRGGLRPGSCRAACGFTSPGWTRPGWPARPTTRWCPASRSVPVRSQLVCFLPTPAYTDLHRFLLLLSRAGPVARERDIDLDRVTRSCADRGIDSRPAPRCTCPGTRTWRGAERWGKSPPHATRGVGGFSARWLSCAA